VEVDRGGHGEVGLVGGTDLELVEEGRVVLTHDADGGCGVEINAGWQSEYLRWWQRSKRACSSSQGLDGCIGTE
jgi:hypothetical protein